MYYCSYRDTGKYYRISIIYTSVSSIFELFSERCVEVHTTNLSAQQINVVQSFHNVRDNTSHFERFKSMAKLSLTLFVVYYNDVPITLTHYC